MDPLGLVVHDEESFLTKVVNRGMDQGIFTRDRADEIIRISVAMANKYVLHKEVDFRSQDELAKVQETILKLVGVGLEMRAGEDVDEGVRLLMEASPVDLFRIAYTRIGKLRQAWRLLLQDHHVELLISQKEYECLDELSCQRLAEMSVFSETEIETIKSLTLEDELFSSLGIVEYYEGELERYQFILRLREILPFEMLNRSPNVRADNLSEVDCVREALLNTLIISAYLDGKDPVTVTMSDVRTFLGRLDVTDGADVFPTEVEDVLLEIIQELGEGLDDHDAGLFTKEAIRMAQDFFETIVNEWATVSSHEPDVFFKRWARLVIAADSLDPLARLAADGEPLDEYDYEMLVEHLSRGSDEELLKATSELPWSLMSPDQVIRLFQDFPDFQESMAAGLSLAGFSAAEIVDFLETVAPDAVESLLSTLEETLGTVEFTIEDLEIIASLPYQETDKLLRWANPPVDYDARSMMSDFGDASERMRRIFLLTTWGTDSFPGLVQEGWTVDSGFMKKFVKELAPPDLVMAFLEAAAGGKKPKVVKTKKESTLQFQPKELAALFGALPVATRRAAVKHFTGDS